MFSIPSETSSKLRSAKNFINFLTRLEYSNASTLQPEQILWAYENEETSYLLDWLCENIDVEKNYIGDNEGGLDTFEFEKIKGEHENVEKEIMTLQKRQSHVIAHRDQLRLTLKDLEEQLANLKRISHELDDKNKDVDRLVEDDSVKFGWILHLALIFTAECGFRYPNSECKYIQVVSNHEYWVTYLKTLEDEVSRLESIVINVNDLTLRYEQYENSIALANQNIESDIIPKVKDYLNILAELEIERPILMADYNIQSKYQESFIDRMDLACCYTAIDLLSTQYARLQLIYQAFNIELDDHKEVHRLLTGVTNELKRRAEGISSRMGLMSASDFVDSKIGRTVVESADNMILSMRGLMNLDILRASTSKNFSRGRRSSTFVTYESVKEKLILLEQARTNARDKMEEELRAQQEFIKSSEEVESTLDSILYKDSFTSELILTPRFPNEMFATKNYSSRTKDQTQPDCLETHGH
ncbi:1206_t:CDS:10 [Acaulospora colombiana]|uniref:1206_t:CDS:1 n=1 Tax=Acaulospora colombiana TaxID=27376 RepID=A0ACA9LWG4_9GLOM|nr:1206_t:CDS:10 [Acaulospora colombiana]